MSKIIGIIGTVLAYLGAGLTDFHAVATSPDVSVALTAVVGFLTAHHIISGAFGKQAETDVSSVIKRLSSSVEAAAKAATEASRYQPPHPS